MTVLIASAAIGVAALVAPATHALGPRACVTADALRASGEKASARKAYVALLKRDPTLACAKRGLVALNAPPPNTATADGMTLCARGDALHDAHRDEDAVAAYKLALEKDPQLQCAKDGLAAVNKDEAAELCARGAALHDAHRDDDAAAAYKTALEQDAALACAKAGIADAGPSTAGRWVDNATAAAPQWAFVAGLVLLLFFLVLLTGYSKHLYPRLVRLWLVGRILSPRLNLNAFKDESEQKVGPSIDARIKEKLARVRDEVTRANAPAYELDFGTPRDDFTVLVGDNTGLRSALEKASEATEQTKLVAALVNLVYAVLPVQRIAVDGVIEPPSGKSPSATLSLARNGTLAASATVTGPPIAPDAELDKAAYLTLAEPSAVWVQYEVVRAIRGGPALSAHAAESYVYVREGLERQFAGDYPRARDLFKRASAAAADNWAAQLNAAMTEARLARNYDEAVSILRSAFLGIKGQPA